MGVDSLCWCSCLGLALAVIIVIMTNINGGSDDHSRNDLLLCLCGWFHQSRTLLNKHGVFIEAVQGGQIGLFNFNTLLIQLTTSLALLATATVLTDMMALYVMPDAKVRPETLERTHTARRALLLSLLCTCISSVTKKVQGPVAFRQSVLTVQSLPYSSLAPSPPSPHPLSCRACRSTRSTSTS